MAFASADRAQLSYVPEVNFGVTPPATAGYNLRMTGESLDFNLTKTSDKEITSDAQPTSSVTTNAQAAGDIKIHMQYAEYDRFIAGVLRSAWTAFGTNGVGATFVGTFTTGTLGVTAGTITAGSATSGSSIFTNLQPGQWFRLNAPTNACDGVWVRNSLTVAPTTTVITLDVNTPLPATATSLAACSIATSRVSNGTTLSFFTIEKQSPDATTPQFFTLRGMSPSKLSFAMTAAQLTEGTISFIGKSSTRTGATALFGSTAASQTYDIHNGVTGVGPLWEGGGPISGTSIKSVSLDIDSNLRAQEALGTLGLVGLGIGTISFKGSMEVYFANGSLYDKFIGDIYTSLILSTRDTQGNGYVFTIPKVQITSSKINATGKNTDLMASFQFEALADRSNAVPALQKTLIIDRLGAAVTP